MGFADRLDKFVEAVSPKWAIQRRKARADLAVLERVASRQDRQFSEWDSADNDRLRGSRWLTSKLSVDSVLSQKLPELRERSRESTTNDPYAASFVDAFVCNVVGREIRVQSRIRAVEGDPILTEANVKRWNDELETLWDRQERRIGTNGESLHELQQLGARHWAIDGEILGLFSAVSSADRPVPLALQIVDPARLETPYSEPGDRIVMGVQRDARGVVVRYHFRKGVVGDSVRDSQEFLSVPADRVAHIFDRWHADQTRGVPKLAPSLGRMKDLRDYHEAELITQQVAACYSVIVSTTNPEGLADANARLTDSNGNPVEEISPGRILYKGTDSQVQFAAPQRPGSAVGDYTESVLRSIAAGANIPYEVLAKDYSRTTYSSGRLSLIDGRLNFQLAQSTMIAGLLRPLWSRFVQQCIDFGETSMDARDFGRRPWLYDRGQWMSPGWPWIDPQKDVQASAEALAANLTTLSDELAARGIDFDEWLERRKYELEKLEEAGIMTDPATPEPESELDPEAVNRATEGATAR